MSKLYPLPNFTLVDNGKVEEMSGIVGIAIKGKNLVFTFENKLYADAFEERIHYVGIAFLRDKEDTIEVF